nr:oxygenase MpaB family protein [Gordonia humi]
MDSAVTAVWGLFGPTSVVWQVNRFTSVNVLATSIGGHLDVAHPAVAWGVAEHSRVFDRPKERFSQTYLLLSRVIFGDVDQVRRVSRSLYSRHSRIEGVASDSAGAYAAGSEYSANTLDGLLWVHLVYFWTRHLIYESTVGSLPESEWDRYVEESRRFGACFGLPNEVMPATLAELAAAVDEYTASGRLSMTPAGTGILDFLATLIPRVVRPAYYRFVTELLAPDLGSLVGVSDRSARRRWGGEALRNFLRLHNRFAPRSIRYVPAFNEASMQIEGRSAGWTVRAFNRRLCGRSTVLS